MTCRIQSLAKLFKQNFIDGIDLRIIFRVPLNSQGESGSIRNSNGLDGAIFRHTFHDHALPGLQNPLTVQGINSD